MKEHTIEINLPAWEVVREAAKIVEALDVGGKVSPLEAARQFAMVNYALHILHEVSDALRTGLEMTGAILPPFPPFPKGEVELREGRPDDPALGEKE